MKSFKSTGFLFILVVIVVGYAYFFEFKGKESKKQQEEKEKTILPEKTNLVTEFTVINPDGKYVFKKVAEKKWEMTEPVQDKASFPAIEGFLNQFSTEKYIEVIAEGEKIDKSIYGFQDKTSQLILKYPKQTWKIEVGTAAALNGRRYVRINDENKILLANYSWEFQLHKDMNDLREKDLAATDLEPVEIDIHNSHGDLHFLDEKGTWILKELKTNDPDQMIIDGIRYQVQSLRASQISKDVHELPKKDLEIHMKSKDGRTLDIALAKGKDNKVLASTTDRKCIFEMPANIMDVFNKTADDFRDRRKPLTFELTKVNEIDYRSDLLSFKIKKEKESWKLLDESAKKDVDTTKVNDLLNKLSELKVKKFLDNGVNYQKSGTQTLVLKDDNNKEVLNLKWSPKPLKDVFVARSQLVAQPFGLSTKDIDALPFHEILKEKKVEEKKSVQESKDKK